MACIRIDALEGAECLANGLIILIGFSLRRNNKRYFAESAFRCQYRRCFAEKKILSHKVTMIWVAKKFRNFWGGGGIGAIMKYLGCLLLYGTSVEFNWSFYKNWCQGNIHLYIYVYESINANLLFFFCHLERAPSLCFEELKGLWFNFSKLWKTK